MTKFSSSRAFEAKTNVNPLMLVSVEPLPEVAGSLEVALTDCVDRACLRTKENSKLRISSLLSRKRKAGEAFAGEGSGSLKISKY